MVWIHLNGPLPSFKGATRQVKAHSFSTWNDMEPKNLLLEKDLWISYLGFWLWCSMHCCRQWTHQYTGQKVGWKDMLSMRFSKGCMLPGFSLSTWVRRLPSMTIALNKSHESYIFCWRYYEIALHFFLFSSCELSYGLGQSKAKSYTVADSSLLVMMLQ